MEELNRRILSVLLAVPGTLSAVLFIVKRIERSSITLNRLLHNCNSIKALPQAYLAIILPLRIFPWECRVGVWLDLGCSNSSSSSSNNRLKRRLKRRCRLKRRLKLKLRLRLKLKLKPSNNNRRRHRDCSKYLTALRYHRGIKYLELLL
jgi:hypothetical protein